MIETKRFHCNECGYFWETTSKVNFSKSCPACSSTRIHRVTGDRRYSRKSRAKVRRSYSSAIHR